MYNNNNNKLWLPLALMILASLNYIKLEPYQRGKVILAANETLSCQPNPCLVNCFLNLYFIQFIHLK